MSVKPADSKKIQIKLPAEVARIMSKWGGHNIRLATARGALPMSGPNLVMVLFVFYHGENKELKEEALSTLQTLPVQILLSALSQTELHAAVIDLIVRLRFEDTLVMEKVLTHPQTSARSLLFLAESASGEVLDMLSHNDVTMQKSDAIRTAIINNPHADRATRLRLGWQEPELETAEPSASEAKQQFSGEQADQDSGCDEELKEDELTKYQLLQELSVNEKIKMALTGDKEWRNLLIREANKQVSTSVLRNPRITEGEVLAVAQNRSSSEELIRIILLNRDWVKIYDMKKALVYHPRTPLQQSMRLMNFLSEKDIRELAGSRNVTQPIINNARRLMMTKKR